MGRDRPAEAAAGRVEGVTARVLALPREAGTAEAAEARRLLSEHLRALGFAVEVQRFSFSTGSLSAYPILGAGLGWLGVIMVPLLLMGQVPAWAAVAVWTVGLLALGIVVTGVAMGWAPARGEQREDANLIARRPGASVTRWIVAHVDTKAQRQSMAGRLVTVAITLLAVILLSVLAAGRVLGPASVFAVAMAAGVALAAGVLLGRARLSGRTVGARDNGSGLVALLQAAERAGPETGFLLTGAEEFGLVGARIVAQQLPELVRGTDVINLDTLDDRGAIAVVAHNGPGRVLAESLRIALAPLGVPVRRRRLPPGILVDSLPLARAGARAVTIARLDWSTLRMMHTARDAVAGLAFRTAREVGSILRASR